MRRKKREALRRNIGLGGWGVILNSFLVLNYLVDC